MAENGDRHEEEEEEEETEKRKKEEEKNVIKLLTKFKEIQSHKNFESYEMCFYVENRNFE